MSGARQLALDCLIRWDRERSYPNLLLAQKLSELPDRRERAFCTELVYGVVERKLTLDYYISKVSSTPFRKLHIVTRNILRMGLYQVMYTHVPANAACSESVSLAKRNGQYKSAGFINAVLRKLAAEYKNMPQPTDLSVRYSVHPTIVQLLSEQYGADFVHAYFSALETDKTKDAVIAINTLKTDAKTLAARLADEGVASEPIQDGLFTISFTGHPESLSSYRDGLFHFIGQPSFEAVARLDVRPDQTVIDCCAAPGGKTFAIAYRLQNRGRLIAMDVHAHKLSRMKLEAKRLGVTNIEWVCADAAKPRAEYLETADRVLCDVPCSGLGIIGKKPDIRYKDLTEFSLYETQTRILNTALTYLKADGKLVYSTCTVNQKENRERIENAPCANLQTDRLFLPQTDHTEGFYIAELFKK